MGCVMSAERASIHLWLFAPRATRENLMMSAERASIHLWLFSQRERREKL